LKRRAPGFVKARGRGVGITDRPADATIPARRTEGTTTIMMMTPPGVLFLWLTGLLSFALVGGGARLLWEWYDDRYVNDRHLWAGLALLALALLGGPLMRLVLPLRPRGADEEDPISVRAPRETRRIDRPDGSELHVEVYGPADAPALVFTHGWGLDGTEWFYAKRHLAGRYQVVTWDLPGLGRSRRPANHDYRLEKLAADLEAVVREVSGGGPVVLVGHSIGGMITLTFCRLFPELLGGGTVCGLALTHTTFTNPVETAKGAGLLRPLQKPLIEPLCHLTVWLSPVVRLMNWLSYANGAAYLNTHWSHFAGRETRGQLDFLTRFSLHASPSVTGRGMLAMMRWDASDVLPRIPIPTLVFTGDEDKATLPEAGRRIADAVPNARLVPLAPVGHAGLIERHREWLDALDAFAAACFDGVRESRAPEPARPTV
jgi:pimeloyl-ACP methyl ester carboxylesterase